MSEAATRRGTREKKPSRQYWFDEADYSNVGTSRNQDQKERLNNAQDLNQIAKLLCKFLHSANHRAKELQDTQATELHSPQAEGPRDADNTSQPGTKRGEGRVSREGASEGRGSRPRDGSQVTNGQGKGGSKEAKIRTSRVPKSTQQLATLETDLNYHNALNEHVKNAYPNINALSPDMLRELSIPTEILGRQQVPRARGKEEKKAGGVRGKEENKPFKRQSYHVAIAYHIHLKQVKNNKSVEYVDPTYPARKLREQTQSEPKKP